MNPEKKIIQSLKIFLILFYVDYDFDRDLDCGAFFDQKSRKNKGGLRPKSGYGRGTRVAVAAITLPITVE